MLNDLLLLSGNDIPFPEAQVIIHPPTIRELALMGEEDFYTGCEFLKFSKDSLNEEDRINLEGYSNFEVLMSIMKEKNTVVQKHKTCLLMLLMLLFPQYEVGISDKAFVLRQEEKEYYINQDNFDEFKKILDAIFCLKGAAGGEGDMNPAGQMAKRIAEKLKRRHQKLAEEAPQDQKKVAILSRYISILAAGEQKDINSLMNYTVYQLFDEFKRYELKASYDIYFQAKMAGAQDLKEVDDWMQDIHA